MAAFSVFIYILVFLNHCWHRICANEYDYRGDSGQTQSKSKRGRLRSKHRVRLYGWNGFIHLKNYAATICTVPKVGSTAVRQWTLNLSPAQLERCIAEIEAENHARKVAPHCKDLDSFRNLTKYKRSGMTRYKLMCRVRKIEPSELLFGRDTCMQSTDNFTISKNLNIQAMKQRTLVTFVRHPIDRFVSWFVDKALMEKSKVHIPGEFDFKRFYSSPGFGASNMINFLWKRREFFNNCSIDYDDHYNAQTCVCLHNYVNYTLIGKLENLEADFASMIDTIFLRTKLKGSDSGHLPRLLPGQLNAHKWSQNAQYVRQNITYEDGRKLFDVYRKDFELFGYFVEDWFKSRALN